MRANQYLQLLSTSAVSSRRGFSRCRGFFCTFINNPPPVAASSALHWTVAKFPQGGPKMNLRLWSLMVLCLCSSTRGMVVDKTRLSRSHSYQTEKGQRIIQHFKRHSDGTFTNDFTKYLDKMKAKNFVEWLASAKGQGCCKDLVQIAAEV